MLGELPGLRGRTWEEQKAGVRVWEFKLLRIYSWGSL